MVAEGKRAVMSTLAGLVVALILPSILIYSFPKSLDFFTQIIIKECVLWTLAAAVLLIVVYWEKQPLSSIGLIKPTRKSLLLGIVSFIALSIVYGVVALLQKVLGISGAEPGLTRLLTLPLWLRLLLVFRAAVVEEILYRGYPIERIAWLSGSRLLGAIITLIVFSLMHLPFWGAGHLLVVVGAGAVLTAVFVWKRDLNVNFFAHFLIDLVGIIIVPLVRH
jgi:membrane protease YdiL (CAAX protease family)